MSPSFQPDQQRHVGMSRVRHKPERQIHTHTKQSIQHANFTPNHTTHTQTLSQSVIFLAEQLDEAALAVRLVVLLFEGALVELLKAEGTDKMLGMELLAHGCDTAARDGLLTAGTQRPAAGVIMDLAVGLTVVLEETAVDEGCEALLKHITKTQDYS